MGTFIGVVLLALLGTIVLSSPEPSKKSKESEEE